MLNEAEKKNMKDIFSRYDFVMKTAELSVHFL